MVITILNAFIYLKNKLYKSKYQTKKWRQEQIWYINGKYNECEKYQIQILENNIIKKYMLKTNERLNYRTLDININNTPLKYNNGFDFTENFDRKLLHNNSILYLNLKFICNNGGAQTRSLREVYKFIETQILYLKKYNYNIYFINILDGDTCNKHIDKFMYLLNQYEFINNNIFCGDMYEFNIWWNINKLKII